MQSIKDFHAWLDNSDEQLTAVELLDGFLTGLALYGMGICRSSIWLPTRHPELWGTQVIFTQDKGFEEFARGHEIASTNTYLNTPGEVVHKTRQAMDWLLLGNEPLPYPMLEEFRQQGISHYVIVPLKTSERLEQPWITFATSSPLGFDARQIAQLMELCNRLNWKVKLFIAQHATQSLLSVYLGKSAATRVLAGEFKRGTGERINAVIWFCDLRGFTQLSDEIPTSELIETLDGYFERISDAIEQHGGDVLKFIGDAVLAIFPIDEPSQACNRAITAAKQVLASCKADDYRLGIALHLGEVTFGNIGGSHRLDFTVIGKAVNVASRIESLCKIHGEVLLTQAVAQYLAKDSLTKIGAIPLRGIKEEVVLFNLKSTKDFSD